MVHQPREPSPQQFGHSAETLAEAYLRHKGYTIVARNLRLMRGELDLVARDRQTVVFVEVKGRRTAHCGGTAYAVPPQKQRQIIKLAMAYLAQHHLTDTPCRFDVILVSQARSDAPHITHIEHAFEVSSSGWQW